MKLNRHGRTNPNEFCVHKAGKVEDNEQSNHLRPCTWMPLVESNGPETLQPLRSSGENTWNATITQNLFVAPDFHFLQNWPEEVPNFKATTLELVQHFDTLALYILKLTAIALGFKVRVYTVWI